MIGVAGRCLYKVPLVGHRGYYLGLDDDGCPYGGLWEAAAEEGDDSDSEADIAAWNWDTNVLIRAEDLDGPVSTIDRALNLAGGYHPESRPMAAGGAAAAGGRRRKKGRAGQGLPLHGIIVKKVSP